MNPEYYKRWQEKNIKRALGQRRILLLAGSRQCGKTTMAKALAGKDAIYRTLDDITLLNAALDDPHGFVHHKDNLMIIDEVQRAPFLLQAVKQDVDENQKPGRFLLTGSANIQSLPSVNESLAGRVTKIRLRPLALGEIYGKKPDFLEKAFKGEFDHLNKKNSDTKESYIEYASFGGYPEPNRLKLYKDRRSWHKDYLDALIERDLADIAQVKRKDSLAKLITVLAAWSSKFLTISDIGTSLGISRPTIETYINALESLYLVERLNPWHKTDYDRISKQDKLFMTDTGMMMSILDWKIEDINLDGDKSGKLFETFVFNQLSAILDAQEDNYKLYHYRDSEKREVDFVIENEKGDILGVEVKAGSAVNKSSFKHLEWFSSNMAERRSFNGIVLYSGQHVASFGKNMWAVPIHALWS